MNIRSYLLKTAKALFSKNVKGFFLKNAKGLFSKNAKGFFSKNAKGFFLKNFKDTYICCLPLALLAIITWSLPAYAKAIEGEDKRIDGLNGYQVSENAMLSASIGNYRQDIDIVIERGKQTLQRRFTTFSRRYDGMQKDLIVFREPSDVTGIKYLTWNYKDAKQQDDMWVFLPENNMTRRISGSGYRGAFMRSDLYNEDLKDRNLDDDTHKLLRKEACGEKECYVVERRQKKADATNYSRRVIWVRGDNWQPTRAEFYGKDDRLIKVDEYGGFKKIDGAWWKTKMLVTSKLRNSRTLLQFSNIRANTDLNEILFSQAALKR